MSIFGKYSEYYDLLYKDKDYEKEAEYISSLLKKHAPSAKTLLDLGCGTGRHDVLLKKFGYALSGVDLSEDMIAKAKSLNSGINFFLGDARSIRLSQKFDAVVSLFHVACYQNTDQDLRSYFLTAREHLNKGGIFIFDVWHGPAVLADLPVKKIREVENENIHVKRATDPELLRDRNIVKVNFHVTIRDKKGGGQEELKEIHSMRYLFPEEISSFLRSAGFEKIHEEQWMTGVAPSSETWYVTYVVKAL